ncbi:DUF6615 family protein [Streptomyces sp. NPDC047515]|uniref:DUF6615 family protein n=1 Tax=Streptomyces sp. NPDC047515 TaxID=3155380 RepID=UPI003411C154
MISKPKVTVGPEQGDVEQVCQCGREASADSRFCRFCGRDLRGKSLCRTLSLCSEYTFGRLSHGHRKGQAPGEVGLTEHHLTTIRMEHADRVAVHWFTGTEEAVNGADWEWWFYAGDIGFGMRIQAKREEWNGSYKLRYRPSNGSLQSDLLIEDAVASGCFPAYVFYNRRSWQSDLLPGALAGCGHGPVGERQFGCTIASALVVQRTLLLSRASTSYVKDRSLPWHRLLCDENESEGRRAEAPYRRVRDLHRAAVKELQVALNEEYGPLTVRPDVPSRPARPRASGRVQPTETEDVRRMERDVLDQELGLAGAAGEQPRDLRQWPLYRRMEEIAERPPSELPNRVRGMILGDDAIAPDERAAGAVLVNLAEDD